MVHESMGNFRQLLVMARQGLSALKAPVPLAGAILLQCLGWLMQLLAVWAAMRAFDIDAPLPAAGLVLVLMNIATFLGLAPNCLPVLPWCFHGIDDPGLREAMAKGRITIKAVTAAKPGEREYFLWDADLLGFGIRVLPSGVKSYVVQYRSGPGRSAPTRRITIGKHGKLTPDEARKLARKIIADVAHGEDPAAELTYRRREITVADLAERYISEHVRVHNKPSTILEVERLVRSEIIPAFGRIRLSDLTRAEIKKWHTARHRTPYNANRALAALRKMLSLAVKEWELCDENPALGVKLFRETKRERFVTDDELRKIGKWLAEVRARRYRTCGRH